MSGKKVDNFVYMKILENQTRKARKNTKSKN